MRDDSLDEAEWMMVDWNEYARDYIDQLGGSERESAYHRLIDADDAVVPVLIGAFRTQQDPRVRALLVEIVWQHRLPETIGLLVEALDDRDPEVWKSALDGLVTFGPLAIQALRSARERLLPTTLEERTRAEWIDEAIQQMQE
jgi:hypothetical protein